MNKKELLELVKTGEGYTLEFKEKLDKSLGYKVYLEKIKQIYDKNAKE